MKGRQMEKQTNYKNYFIILSEKIQKKLFRKSKPLYSLYCGNELIYDSVPLNWCTEHAGMGEDRYGVQTFRLF